MIRVCMINWLFWLPSLLFASNEIVSSVGADNYKLNTSLVRFRVAKATSQCSHRRPAFFTQRGLFALETSSSLLFLSIKKGKRNHFRDQTSLQTTNVLCDFSKELSERQGFKLYFCILVREPTIEAFALSNCSRRVELQRLRTHTLHSMYLHKVYCCLKHVLDFFY